MNLLSNMIINPSCASRVSVLALRVQCLLSVVIVVLDASRISSKGVQTHTNHPSSSASCQNTVAREKTLVHED